MGIDLSVRRPSAYAIARISLTSKLIKCIDIDMVETEHLMSKMRESNIIAVDAPLHPPYKGFRDVEIEAMRHYGARLLPGGTPGLRMLSLLGYSLLALGCESGKFLLETHPGSIKKKININIKDYKEDLIDALISLSVAFCFVIGEVKVYAGEGGILIFPLNSCKNNIILLFRECLLLLNTP